MQQDADSSSTHSSLQCGTILCVISAARPLLSANGNNNSTLVLGTGDFLQ
ncbi:MAG: hypothetical protein ACLTE2_12825 [Eubacteriales bacterium]